MMQNATTRRRYARSATGFGLLTSLVSYWALDEAAGTRQDEYGTNALTDNNTVTGGAGPGGKLPLASQFTATNSEWLSVASNATLQTGDIAFTVCAWVSTDTLGSNNIIIGKDAQAAPNNEWLLYKTNGDAPSFRIYDAGGGGATANANAAAIAATVWYFVVAWHDPATNTCNIQVNAGAAVSASTAAATPVAGTRAVEIGRYASGLYWNGRVAGVGYWTRLLTDIERAYLYNSGSGRSFSAGLGFV